MLYGTPTFGICFAWSRISAFCLVLLLLVRLWWLCIIKCPVISCPSFSWWGCLSCSERPYLFVWVVSHSNLKSFGAVCCGWSFLNHTGSFRCGNLSEDWAGSLGFLVILVIPVSLFLVVLLASVDDLVLGEDGRNVWLTLAIFSNKIMYLRSLSLFLVATFPRVQVSESGIACH